MSYNSSDQGLEPRFELVFLQETFAQSIVPFVHESILCQKKHIYAPKAMRGGILSNKHDIDILVFVDRWNSGVIHQLVLSSLPGRGTCRESWKNEEMRDAAPRERHGENVAITSKQDKRT